MKVNNLDLSNLNSLDGLNDALQKSKSKESSLDRNYISHTYSEIDPD